MDSRLSRALTILVVLVGVGAALAGLSVFVEAWQAGRAWAGSDEAQHATLPAESPRWLDEPTPAEQPVPRPSLAPATDGGVSPTAATPVAYPVGGPAPTLVPTPGPSTPSTPDAVPATVPTSATVGVTATTAPVALAPAFAAPADVVVPEIDFRFLDPPEPGAHARLAVTVANRADAPTGPLGIVISRRWLQDFRVIGAVPDVADDRPEGEAERRFAFAGLAPGQQQTFELHVQAAAEEVDAPEVRVLLGATGTAGTDEAEVGRGRPRTVAPRPRPGPARVVAIAKLGVRAAVVPVPWEPPAFVIGQVHGSAAVSEGNTVLIGHLAGPAGDVFARLSQMRPGDEVAATSRGLEYRFIVSDIAVRPYDDVSPTYPTETPRLTLMTCTGQWSILRQDYSHRLWVVAEPPELAQQTIRANAERAAQAAREAEAAAAERAAHEAEVGLTATAEAQLQPPAQTTPPAVPGAAAAQPAPAPAAGAGPPAAAVTAQTGLPAPPPAPSPSPAADEPLAPGITIDEPADGAPVPTRLAVRGRRTAEADVRRTLWLVVRAEVEGSRWYALDRPLTVDQRGAWEAAIELGGPAGVRHQIRVLSVDAEGDGVLRRHVSERRGQPLDELPPDAQTGARVTVERR